MIFNKYSKLSGFNITEECVKMALSYNTITTLYETDYYVNYNNEKLKGKVNTNY